jgi:hypothetical protein
MNSGAIDAAGAREACVYPRCLDDARNLSAMLAGARLATPELARWCRERRIGDGRVVARMVVDPAAEALDEDSRQMLGGDTEGLVFRKVQLISGCVALVDAKNWYFPDRLTPEMRRLLQTTDCPFGEAIASLGPRRYTFFVRTALPEELDCAPPTRAGRPRGGNGECAGRCAEAPVYVLEHRVVLQGDDGARLAVIHEKYRAVLVCGTPSIQGSSRAA